MGCPSPNGGIGRAMKAGESANQRSVQEGLQAEPSWEAPQDVGARDVETRDVGTRDVGTRARERPSHGGDRLWAAEVAGCAPEALLDFSASISPLGPPASVRAAIEQAMPLVTRYPDPQQRELRAAIALHHELEPDWVLAGNGAAELLTWIGRDLAEQAVVYVMDPGFGDYERALRAFGARIERLLLGRRDEAFALPPLPATLAAKAGAKAGSKAGVILNNPHNPTGAMWSREALLPWLESGALVVVDEAFMDFVPPEAQQSVVGWLDRFPNLVVLRSLTKFYSLPGLRIGYALAHPDRLARWQTWRDPWSVNALAGAAAIAALGDRGFQQQTWDWLGPTRAQLSLDLALRPGLRVYPGSANFLLLYCKDSVMNLQESLLRRHRILIRDCSSFRALGDDFFRIAVRTGVDNHQCLSALDDCLNSLGRRNL